jgi:hypothetical protein
MRKVFLMIGLVTMVVSHLFGGNLSAKYNDDDYLWATRILSLQYKKNPNAGKIITSLYNDDLIMLHPSIEIVEYNDRGLRYIGESNKTHHLDILDLKKILKSIKIIKSVAESQDKLGLGNTAIESAKIVDKNSKESYFHKKLAVWINKNSQKVDSYIDVLAEDWILKHYGAESLNQCLMNSNSPTNTRIIMQAKKVVLGGNINDKLYYHFKSQIDDMPKLSIDHLFT